MAQSLHPFTLFIALMAGLAAVVFGSGVVWVRWRFFPTRLDDRSFDLAMNALRALAVLHALILALVFAEAEIDYTRARESVWREAHLLHNVFRGLSLYDSEAAEETSVLVTNYTKNLVDFEWNSLSENRLSSEASSLFQTAFVQTLQLNTVTSAQKWLRDRILDDMSTLAALRHGRFFEANDRLPIIFWLVIVLGYVLLCGLFATFEKTRINLAVIAAYSFFFGVVSYLIFAFQDPFDGYLKVTSQPLALLYSEVMEPILSARSAAGAD